MFKNIFITGISTEVGKTIASSIAVKALEADYWKPIQSGDLGNSDTMKVQTLSGQPSDFFHKESYTFETPMSPDAAAAREDRTIEIERIQRPKVNNNLVIEGAGGLLVPLNHMNLIADLVQNDDYVILVTKHYLGSINHTLLSYNYLKNKGVKRIAIWINGKIHHETEQSLKKHTDAYFIERIAEMNTLNTDSIGEQANRIKESLTVFLEME